MPKGAGPAFSIKRKSYRKPVTKLKGAPLFDPNVSVVFEASSLNETGELEQTIIDLTKDDEIVVSEHYTDR